DCNHQGGMIAETSDFRRRHERPSHPGLDSHAVYNLADDLVDRHVREGAGERVAIVSDGQRVTYQELHGKVNAVARALTALGVRAGDRVLLVLLDSTEFISAFLGTVRIGAVAVPANTSLRS